MTSLAFAALFCCIVPALSVAVGGVIDVARSHTLSREITRAFAGLPVRVK
jgi:hypothetical protein